MRALPASTSEREEGRCCYLIALWIWHAHPVPILQAAPLARALFAHANIGQEIPAALYDAVAEVLAWAYHSRRLESMGGERPQRLCNTYTRNSIPVGKLSGTIHE
jgi:hypothetical protein